MTASSKPRPVADLDAAVRREAERLGFHRVGVTSAHIPLDDDHDRYRAFVDAGMHGTMAWLAEHAETRRRVDTPDVLDGARSVIVCALAYRREVPGESTGPEGAVIARYARGSDYHNGFRRRLRKLATFVRALAPGVAARPMVDTAPVLERAWAQRAGVGFVGKNGCIIAPGLGSFVLLGEVVTTLELHADEPLESRCGTCTLCLDACPTSALVRPFVLDARRCIAYLTIEHAGTIDPQFHAPIGARVFGCDDCQDVCPYNRTAVPSAESTAMFAPRDRWSGHTLTSLATLDAPAFEALAAGSPLARAGSDAMVRNAVIALGNTADPAHIPLLERIAQNDPDPVVRETATLSVARLTNDQGRSPT